MPAQVCTTALFAQPWGLDAWQCSWTLCHLQTLAKSAKALPVMVWGTVFTGKKYKVRADMVWGIPLVTLPLKV
jgi:hypothetical protein